MTAVAAVGVTHRFPPRDTFIVMSCCGKTLYEVSPCDRMTLDPELVTCGNARLRDRRGAG